MDANGNGYGGSEYSVNGGINMQIGGGSRNNEEKRRDAKG